MVARAKAPTLKPSKPARTIELPTLGANVSVRMNRRLGVTILSIPNYVWDRTDCSTRDVELPGLDLSADTLKAVVVLMVREFTRGHDEGMRSVREQVLRGIGVGDLRGAVDKLTDRLEKLSDRVEKIEERRR